MKILTIFIDMVRANRLQLFQPSITTKNKLSNYLESLGGTVFSNFITPGPDTARAMSAYFTGKDPWENGCDTRDKLPIAFLDKNLKTNIDLFEEYKYRQLFFSDPNGRIFLFPKEYTSHQYNNDLKLSNFLEDINLSGNCHLFIGLSDFHWGLDDLGANLLGEKLGYSKTVNSLSILFDKFDPDTFDQIIIFSDHGFKFSNEYKKQKKVNKLYLHNEDRIRPILFVRKKNQNCINYENRLISLSDINAIYKNILEKKVENLFDIPKRNYICFEDHIDFGYSDFMYTEVFGLVNKDHLYIRNFDYCLTLNREGKFIATGANSKYDHILKNQTTFGRKLNYLKKVPKMYKSICNPDFYSDGSRRIIKRYAIRNKLLRILKR